MMLDMLKRAVKTVFNAVAFCVRAVATILVGIPALAVASASRIVMPLGFLTIGSFFVPPAARAVAYSALPNTTTIAPGIIASAVSSDGIGQTDTERNCGVIGASTALALAARSASFTPQLAAVMNGPTSALWFAVTAVTAGLGQTLGITAARNLSPTP